MGGNRRYPNHAAELAEQRELREAREHGPLHSLTSDQIALHRMPVTIAPKHSRIRGLAWLRFGDADVRATVRVDRWTEDAVGVEVTIDHEQHRCWVWRGACQPLPTE